MRNVHCRTIPVPADRVGGLLDRLATVDDALWPSPAWAAMRLDRPLGVGARGGHGPIRYEVVAHDPGRRVRFAFDPQVGIVGWHEARVVDVDANQCRLVHEIRATARGAMVLLWPTVVRRLHDALVEDLLDNAELATTGRVAHPAVWSRPVRVLHALTERRASQVPAPAVPPLLAARLAEDGREVTGIDLFDAMSISRPPHVTSEPATWHSAIFGRPPTWVASLLRLRNQLVGLVGIERGTTETFSPEHVSGDEVVVAADASHLDFRASVLVQPGRVVVTTASWAHNRRGRAYLGVVRRVHPVVIRSMLGRAAADLSKSAPPAGHRELARRAARTAAPVA